MLQEAGRSVNETRNFSVFARIFQNFLVPASVAKFPRSQ
jgi:hypothetical protein